MNGGKFLLIGVAAFVVSSVTFGFVAFDKYVGEKQEFTLQKIEDNNDYESLKKVEDTARGMIASYKADALKYEQYRYSDSEAKLEWAEQAKMRANQTATSYNEFILKNSFKFENNVPSDILGELPIIP